jgi:hypothetical protein
MASLKKVRESVLSGRSDANLRFDSLGRFQVKQVRQIVTRYRL